jgi:hypothetical protein
MSHNNSCDQNALYTQFTQLFKQLAIFETIAICEIKYKTCDATRKST